MGDTVTMEERQQAATCLAGDPSDGPTDRVCDEGAEPPELWRAVPGQGLAGRPGTSGVNGLWSTDWVGLGSRAGDHGACTSCAGTWYASW